VHLLPPHVYLQLLLGWGEHGLAGAVCATVALSHITAAAAILGLAKFSHDSAVFLGEPAESVLNEALHVHGKSLTRVKSSQVKLASGAHSIGFRMVVCCLCIDLT
jgi:hypothetical protein